MIPTDEDMIVDALLPSDAEIHKRILLMEANKGVQKSADRLTLRIARSMFEAGVAMKKLGIIPADEDMPATPLIQATLNCIEDGTAHRIWAEVRRGPKHPDPDVMWEVWGQVKAAQKTMGLRPSRKSEGAFETVASIRENSNAFPWESDTIEKYYKRCQRVWKDATG